MLQGPIIHFGDFHQIQIEPPIFLEEINGFLRGETSYQIKTSYQLQHFPNWDFLSKSSPTPGHSDQQKPPNSKGQPQHAPTIHHPPPRCAGPTGLGVIFGSLESPGSDVWQLSWNAQPMGDPKETDVPKSYQNASVSALPFLKIACKDLKNDKFLHLKCCQTCSNYLISSCNKYRIQNASRWLGMSLNFRSTPNSCN